MVSSKWAHETYKQLEKKLEKAIIFRENYYQDHEVTVEQLEEASEWINQQFAKTKSKL